MGRVDQLLFAIAGSVVLGGLVAWLGSSRRRRPAVLPVAIAGTVLVVAVLASWPT